jgi:hypothetical protein
LKAKEILSLYSVSQSEIFLTNSHKSNLANRVFAEILPAEQDRVDDNAQVNLGRSQSILVAAPKLPQLGDENKTVLDHHPLQPVISNELLQRLVPTQRHCVE